MLTPKRARYVGERDCAVVPGFQWYQSDTGTKTPLGSMQRVDHVWELNLINLFLGTMISSSGSFDCTDMETVFFSMAGPTGATRENKMQTTLNQLPSIDVNNVQPGFIGLEQSVNRIKGFIFSQSLGSSWVFKTNRLKTFRRRARGSPGYGYDLRSLQQYEHGCYLKCFGNRWEIPIEFGFDRLRYYRYCCLPYQYLL